MAGKIGGVIAVAALVGALFMLAAPGEAAKGECGPITLDQLFPHLDEHGHPLPTTTTTTTAAEETITTGASDSSTNTVADSSTTGAEPTTPTAPSTELPPSDPAPPAPCTSWVYKMEWPVAIESRIFSDFGVDRDGGARQHKGNDLVAPKMAPVVAVADGTVTSVHSTPPDDCCWILITHNDGWQSLYVHLNNDTWRTDDGLGHGVRPGLEAGDTVRAGEVIGWVGDSGNAEDTVPHLHFELRHPEGYSVDPHSSLQAARAAAGELPYVIGPYLDTDTTETGFHLSWLVTQGVFWHCDERGLLFCPDSLAQPEDTVQLIQQMTGLDGPMVPATERPLPLQEFLPRERVEDVLGCGRPETCLQSGITAGDLARLALWANMAQRHISTTPDFDAASELSLVDARQAEAGLRVLGIIGVCHDSIDNERLLRRSEVAQLLSWWILGNGARCTQPAEPTS